MNIEFSQQVF